MTDQVQIAGVIDEAEANMLVAEGVNFLGFPLRLPDGREDLSEPAANSIIQKLPAYSTGVLITYLHNPDEVVALCDKLGVNWVQLHGPVSLQSLSQIRNLRQSIRIIKSLIVRQHNLQTLEQEIDHYSPLVSAFITDTHDPVTDRTGATGKTHDWAVSKRLVQHSIRPVILAGGLNQYNVEEAISFVKPAAVDAHTGLENPDGRKDRDKVRKFVHRASAAFQQCRES